MSEKPENMGRRDFVMGSLATASTILFPRESAAQQNTEGVQLEGAELAKARYDYFRESFDTQRPERRVYKAHMSLRDENNKRIFNESVCVFLQPDETIRFQGRDFAFTVEPQGQLTEGAMPPLMQDFLQLNRREGTLFLSGRGGNIASMGINFVESCDPELVS